MLKQPFELGGRQRFVSASFGLALAGEDAVAEDLIRDADAAMYQAKGQGKARLEVFDESLRTKALERLELEAGLRDALAQRQLELHYQPEIDLKTGALYGMEALLRWTHPIHGEVSPARFVPIAEQSGLIVPIGEWVLATACIQAAEWRAAGHTDFVMAVNLCPRQLCDPEPRHGRRRRAAPTPACRRQRCAWRSPRARSWRTRTPPTPSCRASRRSACGWRSTTSASATPR